MYNSKFELVKVKALRPSSILPMRTHDSAISESVKKDGVQQPVIVRKVPGSDGYEIVDGVGRVESLDPEQEILVEVRSDLSDIDVFRISEVTFKRTERSAYESAVFYAKYLETAKKELGEKGTQAEVAREAGIDGSLLSQYLTINEMFVRLSQLGKDVKFENLKRLGTNKLFELSRLRDHPKLLESAGKVDENADVSTEGVHQIVQEIVDATLTDTLDFTKTIEPVSASSAPVESQDVAVEENESTVKEDAMATKTQSKFEVALDKLSAMVKDLDTALSNIRTQAPSLGEASSLKTLRTVEKISTSVRRLLYYLRRLNSTVEREAK